MKYYNRICTALCKGLMAVCCVLMTLILCCSALQVISRYAFGSSITWTEEAARYSFIWLDMLGAAILTYKGGHAVVDLFSHKLSPRAKQVYQTAIYLAVFYVGVILTRYGIQLSQATFKQTSASLKLPMGLVYGVMPLCGIFVCFFTVNLVLNLWVKHTDEQKGGND